MTATLRRVLPIATTTNRQQPVLLVRPPSRFRILPLYEVHLRNAPRFNARSNNKTGRRGGGTLTFWLARIEFRFSFPKRRFWFRCGFRGALVCCVWFCVVVVVILVSRFTFLAIVATVHSTLKTP